MVIMFTVQTPDFKVFFIDGCLKMSYKISILMGCIQPLDKLTAKITTCITVACSHR